MKIAQISCKQRHAPVWAIQVLLWWWEDLASLSTAAHATLNTPLSPCAFLPSDIRVKQTRQTSELKYCSSFWAIARLFRYPAFTQCNTKLTQQRLASITCVLAQQPSSSASSMWKCVLRVHSGTFGNAALLYEFVISETEILCCVFQFKDLTFFCCIKSYFQGTLLLSAIEKKTYGLLRR